MEEDIREVLKEETGTDIFFKEEEDSVPRSCKLEVSYNTCNSEVAGIMGTVLILFFLKIFVTESFCKKSQKIIGLGSLGKRRA